MELKEAIKENLQNFIDGSPCLPLVRNDEGGTSQKCTISEEEDKIVITIIERPYGNQT